MICQVKTLCSSTKSNIIFYSFVSVFFSFQQGFEKCWVKYAWNL